MIDDESDLIAELLTIAAELKGTMTRSTTYASTGRSSKKIVIEYDIKENKR
tara:strand:- start:268 stop:420 length:153 start_codon:yes stop_codon:yes gene_type:complete